MGRALLLALTGLLAGCGLDPRSVTACEVDADCIEGRRCQDRTCVLGPAGSPDAGGLPDAGLEGCIPELAEGLQCVDQIFCGMLVDGDLGSSWGVQCYEDPDGLGCAADGRFEGVDLRLSFDAPTTVRGVRFVSDWWSMRPLRFEVWGAATATATPERGATRVVSAAAKGPPWRCVEGLPCDYLTPDICCPHGRDQPIDMSEAEPNQGKYDFTSFPATKAQFWTLRFIGSDAGDAMFLSEVELLTSVCVTRL